MNSSEQVLSAKQVKTIECLLSESSMEEAAKKAGISRATLTRWLATTDFQAAYREARTQLLENVLTSLQAASIKAVQTLVIVMDDTTAQASARVSAARTVLDNLLRSREQMEIEERLRALEQTGGLHDKPNSWTN